MEGKRRVQATLMCFLLAGLFSSQSFVTLVMSRSLEEFAEQKNYYPPDPHAGSPPKHSHTTPSCSTPSHGGSGGTPSHGGGGSYGTPPSHGTGGYYPTPPVILTPPSPTFDPVTPTPFAPPTPTTPTIPSPPLIPDPNVPPFFIGPYNYWRTHPAAIWALFGYWGTVGMFFGAPAAAAFGRNLSIQEALANTRTDGIGALYREGTASFLNSMVNKKFAFTPQQVKDAFVAAIATDKAARATAQLFKQANEGHLKH